MKQINWQSLGRYTGRRLRDLKKLTFEIRGVEGVEWWYDSFGLATMIEEAFKMGFEEGNMQNAKNFTGMLI